MIKRTNKQHSKQGKAVGNPRQPGAPKGEAESRAPYGPDKTEYKAADSSSGIPVVGIGGSAGSFEPFKTFFTDMHADSGAAFVVIQHLYPTHESLLPEILAQHTRMKVVEARDAIPLEPNCVYVIPPNQYLAVRDGVLYLVAPIKQRGIRMPIDFFFRSLAEDRQERAICILFSGAGSDGTLGVRAVRGAGGLSIAQDPQTAQFSDMPRSAVATGMVDFVLSPDRMSEVLMNYLRHPYVRDSGQADVLEAEGKPGGLHEILALLLAKKGRDFLPYKQGTILRRIERRMGLHHISNMAQYYDLVRQDADEVNQLLKDLLINVTSFFRDAEAFEELRQKAIAPLVKARQNDEPLRVWVTGCSSGEEAYSLAMLLTEEVAASGKNCPVQIYATDADEEALEFARQGIYPESIIEDVEPERLARFFIRKDQSYQVSESIRKLVVFAVQNLITDPPFSRVDIISCRNLLIYLDTDTQAKLIPLFNFALNPGGYLFLGKSEGISGQNDLFDVVSKKARLYRRLIPPGPIVLDTPILPGKKRALPAVPQVIRPPAVASSDVIRQALLSHFAASVVLVDMKGQIIQFHGQTGKYLNMPTGEPVLNIRDIAKEGLSTRLLGAMHKAAQDGKTVVLDSVPVTQDEDGPFVRVTIAPTSQRGEAPLLLAVIFEDVPRPLTSTAEQSQGSESETVVKQLEDELRATQHELHYSTEELQASNEELRVANEEVVSSNEELQSTVEELETSKEELQSVNEELTTVNSELHDKVERLAEANSDMDNFLKSTEILTLFLDSELRIKLFTPVTTRLLKLIPSDIGRKISDLAMNFIGYKLTSDALAVARGAAAIEREVQHSDGSYYLVRVMPYHTKQNRIDGVVVTFSDVTRLRRAEKQTRRLATVVTDSNDAVILFDGTGKIMAWNRGAQNLYGWSEAEALGMTIQEMTPSEKIAEVDDLILRMIAGEIVAPFETRRKKKDGSMIDIWLTATAVRDESGKMVEAIATTERDMTERNKAEEDIRALNEQLKRQVAELDAAIKEMDSFAYSVSHDLRAPLRHMSGFVNLLQQRLRDSPDVNTRHYMDAISEASNKMGTLIDDLLNFSRLGRAQMQKRKINLNALVSEVISEIQEELKERKIRWEIDELPDVLGDRSLLRLAIVHLVSNAVKFTSTRPQAEIKIGCIDDGDKFTCSVTDNGVGFDMKYVDKIFGVFQRLHTANEFEGTGIGLAIVQRIIARHDGTVWAEGAVGQGATFYFTLPKIKET